MVQKSDLPFGSEFSPSQIELPELLDLAMTHAGDVKALQAAIQARFFSMHGAGNAKNQAKLAMNCRLGMKAYGLIDEDANLTDFGRRLHSLRNDESKLYEALARHILLNLKGMALVQCIRDMTAAGEVVNLTTLRSGLAERGIHYPSGGKADTNLSIVMIDRTDLNEIRNYPTHVVDAFNREARHAMTLKQLDL